MRRARTPRPQRQGFTLIELLIVVVIIAILAAVAVPMVLSRLEQAQAAQPKEPVERLAQAAPSARVEGASADKPAQPPVIESLRLQVRLDAAPVLAGTRVQSRYEAAVSGTLTLRNADAQAERLQLFIPFPGGITEARDVSLQRVDAEGRRTEAEGAEYGLEGIRWTGPVPPGESVTLALAYALRGRDAFVYDVTGPGRMGKVHVEVQLRHARRLEVPADSLQPTEVSAERIVWSFDRVVASRPLVVELPADASPLGRLLLLCKLAALAVLLFGGGFWYLSELRQPGSLDDFRWGHFLLLALNYTLFFVVFAVVGYRGAVLPALGVASAVGLPLLTLHVARLADVRFALGRNLPLAVLTLGAVVGAVYAEAWRAHVLLGLGVVALAFVTPTYRRWSTGRQAHVAAKEEARLRGQREEERARQLSAVEALLEERAELMREAAQSLEGAAGGLEREREEVQKGLSRLEAAKARLEALRAQAGASLGAAQHLEWAREQQRAAKQLQQSVESDAAALRVAVQRLRHRQAQLAAKEEVASQPAAHCMACGASVAGTARYCAECGTQGTQVLACARCTEVTYLPAHLLHARWTSRTLHCRRCGEHLPRPEPGSPEGATEAA
jgi:prepilin-type N-terminal cleavage/methylation domain-containing protein